MLARLRPLLALALASRACSSPEPAPPPMDEPTSSVSAPAPPPAPVASAAPEVRRETSTPFEIMVEGNLRELSLHELDGAVIASKQQPSSSQEPFALIQGDRYEEGADLGAGLPARSYYNDPIELGGRWPDAVRLLGRGGVYRWDERGWTPNDELLQPESAIGGFVVQGDRRYVVRRSLDERKRTIGLAAFDVYDAAGKKLEHRRSVFAVGPGCFGGKYHMDLAALPDGEVLLLGDKCNGPRGGGAPAVQRWKPGAKEGVVEPLPLRAAGASYHHPRASVLVARAPSDVHVLGWVEDDAPHPCAWHHDGTSWSLEVGPGRGKLLWGNVTRDGTIWGAFGPSWGGRDAEPSVVWRRRPGKDWESVPLPARKSRTYGYDLWLRSFVVTPEGSVWAAGQNQYDQFYLMLIPTARSGGDL